MHIYTHIHIYVYIYVFYCTYIIISVLNLPFLCAWCSSTGFRCPFPHPWVLYFHWFLHIITAVQPFTHSPKSKESISFWNWPFLTHSLEREKRIAYSPNACISSTGHLRDVCKGPTFRLYYQMVFLSVALNLKGVILWGQARKTLATS